MDETLKHFIAGRQVANRAFAKTQKQMTDIYANIPTMSDNLRWVFSSSQTISAIAKEVDILKEKTPANKHLVVTLRTPDGRVMDVETVRDVGDQAFIAKGYIEGMSCMIVGRVEFKPAEWQSS